MGQISVYLCHAPQIFLYLEMCCISVDPVVALILIPFNSLNSNTIIAPVPSSSDRQLGISNF